MNNWLKFLIGVILGIILSVSILQNDIFTRIGNEFSANDAIIKNLAKVNEIQATTANEKKAVEAPKQEILPQTTSITTANSQKEVQTSPAIPAPVTPPVVKTVETKPATVPEKSSTPVIKWAPGKESNIDKFIQAATSVQDELKGDQQTPAKLSPKAKKQAGKRKDGLGPGVQPNDLKDPIQLESQKKLYKKLKSKEQLFVGDNDEITNNNDIKNENPNKKKKSRGDKIAELNLPLTSSPISSESSLYSPNISIVNGNGLPPISYHTQSLRDFRTYEPLIPSITQITKEGKKLPDMSRQRGVYEGENLKIHLCNGVFEAYSASYLTTKEHMLAVASESYNLTWVNCEMASFIHMKESQKFYKSPNHHGIIMQSLDVLDFSVIHLSAFERSSLKHKNLIWENEKDRRTKWSNIDQVIEAGKKLELLNNPKLRTMTRKIQYSPEAEKTVVVMPFLGGAMGAGHSKLGNRFEYLKTCFWSLYEFFPHIVISVTRQEDVDWGWKESGLPFFDIILITNLPKSASLPVATTQQTKLRLQSGQWNFSYVFFSESDQILISRELQLMYAHLKKYPGHMMLPHRLMPYSPLAITKAHKRDVSLIKENIWMNQSCCLPRQNCIERTTWKSVKSPVVPMINYYGLYVPLGNINFLREEYRYCYLSPYIGDYCP